MSDPTNESDYRLFVAAVPNQIDKIECLMRAAFDPYVQLLGRKLTPNAYRWLEAAIENNVLYVAMEDSTIIGVIACTRDGQDLVIDQIAVHPTRQNAGVGQFLLEKVESLAYEHGQRSISLDTALMMKDLLRFYHRNGFKEVNRALPKHGKDPHMRVYLKKLLV